MPNNNFQNDFRDYDRDWEDAHYRADDSSAFAENPFIELQRAKSGRRNRRANRGRDRQRSENRSC